MYDNPINPNHDPRKAWTQIPKFKQHYVNMIAGIAAGDRHPDWEEYAYDQLEYMSFLETMYLQPDAEH